MFWHILSFFMTYSICTGPRTICEPRGNSTEPCDYARDR